MKTINTPDEVFAATSAESERRADAEGSGTAHHTPGPWTATTMPLGHSGARAASVITARVGGEVVRIATTSRQFDADTDGYNAHLIASAPTLAADLATVTEQRDALAGAVRGLLALNQPDYERDIALAALKLAEGTGK